MNSMAWLNIVFVIMALILVGSALASYRLSARKALTMVLAWGAIFAITFLVFQAAR
jgi:hypothetical protein